MPTKETTHFGFQSVNKEDKAYKVADVFHRVAGKYDLMNDLMSLGIHRIWKWMTLQLTTIKSDSVILDLAGGTGDLALKMAPKLGSQGQLVLGDINDSMLNIGRNRIIDAGLARSVEFTQCNAESLPFQSDTFDLVTMAFGLRNVTDKDKALASIHSVLKPGGQCIILEFSKPTSKLFSKLYDYYSFSVLPKLGQFIAKDADSYQYLAESIRMHPNQDTLQNMMENVGFTQCQYHNLTGGIVAIHRGYKI